MKCELITARATFVPSSRGPIMTAHCIIEGKPEETFGSLFPISEEFGKFLEDNKVTRIKITLETV